METDHRPELTVAGKPRGTAQPTLTLRCPRPPPFQQTPIFITTGLAALQRPVSVDPVNAGKSSGLSLNKARGRC